MNTDITTGTYFEYDRPHATGSDTELHELVQAGAKRLRSVRADGGHTYTEHQRVDWYREQFERMLDTGQVRLVPAPMTQLRWHTYGPVDVALDERDRDQPVVYARFDGDTFRQGDTGQMERDAESGQWDPVMAWYPVGQWSGGPVADAGHLDTRFDRRPQLLDAAAELCWYEWECFRAADAQMGDPNP